MLIVETIAKIRRYHFVEGKGIKEICRLLGLSRNTVRKVIVDYIEMFYNSRCRHFSLGYMNPMEFENQKLWKKAD